MRLILRVAAVPLLCSSLVAYAAPEVGWWWNPNESGRGFFIESQNGIFYLAGYFYGADGRPTWAVAGSPNADPYRFDGQLLAYANGQSLFGDYKAPSVPAEVGAISVRFRDDTHGTLTWPGGTVAIERQVFGGGAAAFQPSNGWWWNASESGRGYTIELQGDKLFVAGFMYDDAGNPVWYYSAGPMSSPTRYSAPWLQFAGGQTMTGPYRPPSAPEPVGQLEIEFTATDQAVMKFDDSIGSAFSSRWSASDAAVVATGMVRPQAGRSRIINVRRQFRDPPPPQPGSGTFSPAPGTLIKGRYYEERKVGSEIGGLTTAVEVKVTGENLVWRLNDLMGIDSHPFDFTLMSGELAIEYRDFQFGAGFNCETPLTRTTFAMTAADGELEFDGKGNYRLKILKYPLPFVATRTCRTAEGTVTADIPHQEWSTSILESGSMKDATTFYGERISVPIDIPPMNGTYTMTYWFEIGHP